MQVGKPIWHECMMLAVLLSCSMSQCHSQSLCMPVSSQVLSLMRQPFCPCCQVWTDHFQAIYSLQKQGQVFDNPEALLRAVGLYNLTQLSCAAHLKVGGLAARY